MGVPKKRTSISKSKIRRNSSYYLGFKLAKVRKNGDKWVPNWCYYRRESKDNPQENNIDSFHIKDDSKH